jgi:hypothetical protein
MRLAHVLSATRTAMLITLAVGGIAVTTAARAEIRQTTISQSTFESRCRQMGGTLDTGGTAQIKICKLPGGQTVACDFSTSPAYCDVYRPNASINEMLTGGPKSLTQDTGKSGPKADGGPSTVN